MTSTHEEFANRSADDLLFYSTFGVWPETVAPEGRDAAELMQRATGVLSEILQDAKGNDPRKVPTAVV